jgi:3-methyladenine DNA glycosylase AlkD
MGIGAGHLLAGADLVSVSAQGREGIDCRLEYAGNAKRTTMDHEALTAYVETRFHALADPEKAVPMGKYMKTDMPFYGIQKKSRAPVVREIVKRFEPQSHEDYRVAVSALWNLPHREEKYAAIDYAQWFDRFIVSESIPLYELLIREGSWWDLVDGVASNLVGRALLKERASVSQVLERWIDDPDRWIRRTALLAHLKHKSATDKGQLLEFCLRRASDRDFFIRKAIGWVLREYGKTAPEAVVGFVHAHADVLSSLSQREALKHLHGTEEGGR